MRRDSLRLFKHIQLKGSLLVLDIQITVGVILNEIQRAAGTLVAHWIPIGDPEHSCLISNTLLHTYIYFLLCKGDIIITISLAGNFIILVFLIEHMFIDSI